MPNENEKNTILKTKVVKAFKKRVESAPEEEIIEIIKSSDEANELLSEISTQIPALGEKITQGDEEKPSKNLETARGLGALNFFLENFTVAGIFTRLLGVVTTSTIKIISSFIIMFIIVITVFLLSTSYFLAEIPTLREKAPELYCSITYRIYENHTYEYCDNRT